MPDTADRGNGKCSVSRTERSSVPGVLSVGRCAVTKEAGGCGEKRASQELHAKGDGCFRKIKKVLHDMIYVFKKSS